MAENVCIKFSETALTTLLCNVLESCQSSYIRSKITSKDILGVEHAMDGFIKARLEALKDQRIEKITTLTLCSLFPIVKN